MSKLTDLINELCPDGIEYIGIGEIAEYEQPSKYIVSSTDYSDDYAYGFARNERPDLECA